MQIRNKVLQSLSDASSGFPLELAANSLYSREEPFLTRRGVLWMGE